MLKQRKSLPVNIKFLIEGEEESGSYSLSQILANKTKELAADYLLIVDVGMPDEATPAITLGMRGLTACTVEVEGANSDLHSGSHGGLVFNPLHALIEILASLRDVNGHITVPGFYDSVHTLSEEEKKTLSFDFDEADYEKEYGTPPCGGEKTFSPLERTWLRPTLELNGVHGGYAGPGTKTVIPAKAQAKISCRLVPNQDPVAIGKCLKEYIEKKAPLGVKVSCTINKGMGKPLRTSPHSKLIQALKESAENVYNKEPKFILEGASIPITAELKEASGADVALFGLGLASDKIHAPNECFSWDRIKKGFCIMCNLLDRLGA